MHLLPENVVQLSAASIQQVDLPLVSQAQVSLDVLRLDKIDPIISGNKWFKLKYYLEAALENRHTSVLTFGGAWSNHIVATAAAAKKTGLQSIGIIRGESPAVLSAALLEATGLGMQLVFVSREQYNQKKDPAFIDSLRLAYGQPCIIPEGGAGLPGQKGAEEITRLFEPAAYTHLACAMGTGTLLAGLAAGVAQSRLQIIGIPVLKGFGHWLPPYLTPQEAAGIRIVPDYHQGGYAKKNEALLEFMNQLYEYTQIPTDFVYTGKLFFSIMDLIKKDYFPKGSRLLAIHSGGLQGNQSLPPGTLVF